MTGSAAFCFQRRVLIGEWPLLIRVALDTGGVSAGRESRLFRFKAAVRVVTIATLDGAFLDLVVKRLVEVRFHFIVATHAELCFANLQQCDAGVTRLFRIGL